MAFIDELYIHARAGKGGDGVVRWRHEKSKEFSGPSGGNGGQGGDVFIKSVSDLSILQRYKSQKKFAAKDGDPGFRDSMHGKNGEDLYIELPVGSVVKNMDTGEVFSLDKRDQVELILKGGRGGLGNEYFKSSTNRSPEESTPGTLGEEADFYIELQMVADIGLIGLPNAGKSSLLNVLTRAQAKVGNYAFTTLEPNLGDMYGTIIADIPGLIEGASEGRGLGHKFLRHIKRTRSLIHCVSVENEDPLQVYNTVRDELLKSDNGLKDKPEIILLTKTDLVDVERLESIKDLFKKKTKKEVFSVSVYDTDSIKMLTKDLLSL